MATRNIDYAVKQQDPPTEIADADRDALHVLPLTIVPLETPALSRARLIKNANLETVVELFVDARTGSGQLNVESLPLEFGWSSVSTHPDLDVLRKLALLPSFDVYSLRVLLRQHGIAIDDYDALKLSASKNRELTHYMSNFTRPLICEVYGQDKGSAERFEKLVERFKNPDTKSAVAKLKMLASRLQIQVNQVPRFLEDYGDIYLSLAYYRDTIDRLTPAITAFHASIGEIRSNRQIAEDRQIMETCKFVYEVLSGALSDVRAQLDDFDERTKNLWINVDGERFQAVRSLITRSHTTIGGTLCALNVKMNAWSRKFPFADAGGLLRRADFIMNEMRPGLDKMKRVEAAASTRVKSA